MHKLGEISHYTVIDVAEEDKKLNATYIISVARKLGCSIFLLPEDIIEVRLFCTIGCVYFASHLTLCCDEIEGIHCPSFWSN